MSRLYQSTVKHFGIFSVNIQILRREFSHRGIGIEVSSQNAEFSTFVCQVL